MRPIDADALLELYANAGTLNIDAYNVPVPIVRQNIIDAPTLDYAPVVHASWIRQDDTYTKFQCGACKVKNFDRRWYYCPLCGALMDGKDDT